MSSNQPENLEDAEDVSVPILSNRFRLLVVPQKLQGSIHRKIIKTYRTRESERGSGRLKRFMDLPMDVVFETAMYLVPKDLLHLSRISKQFRSIFASRSAIFVWKTALFNVDLKCYEDLNEIQFASFLYDKFCMACGRITKECRISSMIRLRLCPICQSENLITKNDLLKQYPNADGLINELPASSMDDKCFKPEAHLLIDKFLSLKKENSRNLFIANMEVHTKGRYRLRIKESSYPVRVMNIYCRSRDPHRRSRITTRRLKDTEFAVQGYRICYS
jgi:hypothetical protein